MFENIIAVIGKNYVDAKLLGEEVQSKILGNMDKFSVSGNFLSWYDLHLWDKKFSEMSPDIITIDAECPKLFKKYYKEWKGIVLLIDGEAFDVETDNRSEFQRKACEKLEKMGELDILKDFFAADKDWNLPPVCINIIKSDCINTDWINSEDQKERELILEDALYEIIKEKYSIFFDKTYSNQNGIMILTTSYSQTSADGTKIPAKNIEHLMFFMLYSVFAMEGRDIRMKWDAAQEEFQTLEKKLFKSEAIQNRMDALVQLNNDLKGKAYYLKTAADTIHGFWQNDPPIYMGSRKTSAKSALYALASYWSCYGVSFSRTNERYWNGILID